MKKVFEYWPLWLLLGMFFCMQVSAQNIMPVSCPSNRTLTTQGKMISFQTLCDNVEFVDEGILIPTACPFTAKIQGFDKQVWLSYPCPMFLKYYKETEGAL